MKTQTFTPLEEYLAQQYWHVELPHLKAWRVTKKLSLTASILFLASICWMFYFTWNLAEVEVVHREVVPWRVMLKALGPMVVIGMLMSVVPSCLEYRYNYSNHALKQRAALLSFEEQVNAVAERLSAQLSSIMMEQSTSNERKEKVLAFIEAHQQLLETPEVSKFFSTKAYFARRPVADRATQAHAQAEEDRLFALWAGRHSPFGIG